MSALRLLHRAAVAALVATGCSNAAPPPAPAPLSIAFAAKVNGAPFACGQAYEGVGSPGTRLEPMDLRLYVSDVVLLGSAGERWPFRFESDGVWQDDTVALLDFEDGQGLCTHGTPGVHTSLLGHADGSGVVTGVSFRIGVPEAKNHLDLRTAAPPLAQPELWWSWKDGYSFLRVEVRTPQNDPWSLWVGSAPYACGDGSDGGDPGAGADASCTVDPRPVVTLTNFALDRDAIVLDLGRLFAAVDLDFRAPQPALDRAPSCFMDFHAGDCPPVLSTLGIDWAARLGPDAAKQTFVTSAPR